MEIRTGISPRYAARWTRTYALREVLQNALDQKTETGADYDIAWRDGMATISDRGAGLELRHLVFGVSEKGENSIGQFGEGLKLALMVCAREGAQCTVRTRDMAVRPVVVQDPVLGTDVLVYQVQENLPMVQGTTIAMECQESELLEAKALFAQLQEIEFLTPDISIPGGKLYVNGAVAMATVSKYSFHILDKTLVNRDRDTADMGRVKRHLQEIISRTTHRPFVLDYLNGYTIDTEDLEHEIYWSSWQDILAQEVLPIWQECMHSLYGKRAARSSGSTTLDAIAQHENWHIVKVPNKALHLFQRLGMPAVMDVVKSDVTGARIAPRFLSDAERDIFSLACRTVNRRVGELGKVTIMEDLKKGDHPCPGLCNQRTGKITINRSILQDLSKTIEVLVHELNHKLSGADDCTDAFQDGLSGMLAKVLVEGMRGENRRS